MADDVGVRQAEQDDIAALAELVAVAMWDEPMSCWLFPEASNRTETVVREVRVVVEKPGRSSFARGRQAVVREVARDYRSVTLGVRVVAAVLVRDCLAGLP